MSVERGKRELELLIEEHNIGRGVSAEIAAAMSQIGVEELGGLVFASGTINELRHLADLASGALAVAERLAAEREADAGRAILKPRGEVRVSDPLPLVGSTRQEALRRLAAPDVAPELKPPGAQGEPAPQACVRRGKPMGSADLPAWHSARLKTVSALRKAAQEPRP